MEDVSTPSRFLKECLGMDSADLRLTSGIITRYNSGELNPFEQSFAKVAASPPQPKQPQPASAAHVQDRAVSNNATNQQQLGTNTTPHTKAADVAGAHECAASNGVAAGRDRFITLSSNVAETVPPSKMGIASIAESARLIALNVTGEKSPASAGITPSLQQNTSETSLVAQSNPQASRSLTNQPPKPVNGISHNLDSYGASQPSTASSADEAMNQDERKNGNFARRTRKRNRSTVSAEKDDDNEDPEEKRRRFLERNRIAASKCRQKKKMWIADLEKQGQEVAERNAKLTALVAHLSEEVQFLKRQMQAHSNCDCRASVVQRDGASSSNSAR
ncbi:hypothetical protein BJ742DRAFT_859261 [Cladochytrium replicatum]|nr:hypothetical protein BJ742DRAFT_859261 [Cladochytrium replicatum]